MITKELLESAWKTLEDNKRDVLEVWREQFPQYDLQSIPDTILVSEESFKALEKMAHFEKTDEHESIPCMLSCLYKR